MHGRKNTRTREQHGNSRRCLGGRHPPVLPEFPVRRHHRQLRSGMGNSERTGACFGRGQLKNVVTIARTWSSTSTCHCDNTQDSRTSESEVVALPGTSLHPVLRCRACVSMTQFDWNITQMHVHSYSGCPGINQPSNTFGTVLSPCGARRLASERFGRRRPAMRNALISATLLLSTRGSTKLSWQVTWS